MFASVPRSGDETRFFPYSGAAMLKGKTPLIVAIVLGLLAGIVSYSAIKRKETEVKAGWGLVPVIVAAQEISQGTTITYEMVAQRPIPEMFVTSSVIKPDSSSYIVGQKVLVDIQQGDPLLWSQFETTKATERLSSIIQRTFRAVTIAAGEKQAVGGWVRPNDHVDLVGTFRDPQNGANVALTLLQNVIVLATGKMTGTTNPNLVPENQREYRNVTLLVLPEEAELLTLATELGQITLTLRNAEDIDVGGEDRGHATIQTLLTGARQKLLLGIRTHTTIQVFNGKHESFVPGGVRHGGASQGGSPD
jgi:pilus assembly protein CpaB